MADKTYVVRTFGCQMNEHDSERIAGLLEADGLRPAASVDDADVVVLNTCCIRENADNKLYGNLGQLKALKQRRPDMQIVVGGCLAQKDRDLIVERAPHVDVVFGTHNVHRAAELVGEQRGAGRSLVEILEETAAEDHESFPSALPARREVPMRAGSPSRSAATTRARSASCPRSGAGRSAGCSTTSWARSGRWPPMGSPR